jgi:hypothetical protein
MPARSRPARERLRPHGARPLIVGGSIGARSLRRPGARHSPQSWLPHGTSRRGGRPRPRAEVVVEPAYVTSLLPVEPVDARVRPRAVLEAVALAPQAQLAWEAPMAAASARATAASSRSRTLQRLCIAGPVLRRVTVPILNASGCLDALTAPEVALALDAFVTKTITRCPGGSQPVRIAETDAACSTHRAPRPRHRRPGRQTLPAPPGLACASGSPSAASPWPTTPASASASTSAPISR